MPTQLTIRHTSPELKRRLKERARREGKSVNTLVVDVLRKSVGLSDRGERLKRYTTWTKADFDEFSRALKAQRGIDDKLWR